MQILRAHYRKCHSEYHLTHLNEGIEKKITWNKKPERNTWRRPVKSKQKLALLKLTETLPHNLLHRLKTAPPLPPCSTQNEQSRVVVAQGVDNYWRRLMLKIGHAMVVNDR